MRYVHTRVLAVVATVLASGAVGAGAAGAAAPVEARPAAKAPATGLVSIIQAVPNDAVSVTVDGRSVSSKAALGSVVGPLRLSPGRHTVEFTGNGMALTSNLRVSSGSNSDVVLHRPAAVGGNPVISRYRTPAKPIGPGKARVLIAHTATVAPADVRLDGKVVFSNIANGEYATADVAAGKHVVALLPTGLARNPILGPIDVRLKPRTVTMVYAVGDPDAGSMQVIAHEVGLQADGSVAPDTIDTGSAGLAADVAVRPFSSGRDEASDRWLPVGLAAALVLLLAVPVSRRRGQRPSRT